MKKRGLSHIEVILSFIIFIGAVGFALYFFSPTNSSRLVDTSLDYINREISKNITVNLKTYSINVNNTPDANGNSLSNPPYSNTLPLQIDGICSQNNGSRVENISGEVLPSRIGQGGSGCSSGGDKIYVKNEAGWEESDFIYVKVSEDLNNTEDPNSGGNPPLNKRLYKISTVNSEELFSEKRILGLNKTYYENYYELKEQFNLPRRVNFGFSFSFTNGDEIKAERMIPSGLEVFSKVDRVEVLRKNGKVEYADFIMKVW